MDDQARIEVEAPQTLLVDIQQAYSYARSQHGFALGGWCETRLLERGECGLEEGDDARESLGWRWMLRDAKCWEALNGFWGLLGAASG